MSEIRIMVRKILLALLICLCLIGCKKEHIPKSDIPLDMKIKIMEQECIDDWAYIQICLVIKNDSDYPYIIYLHPDVLGLLFEKEQEVLYPPYAEKATENIDDLSFFPLKPGESLSMPVMSSFHCDKNYRQVSITALYKPPKIFSKRESSPYLWRSNLKSNTIKLKINTLLSTKSYYLIQMIALTLILIIISIVIYRKITHRRKTVEN